MARTGRRPGDTDTRGAILRAARSAFGAQGYHGATIRSIASDAGVDPALVHHYFGTKEDLFAACIELPVHPGHIADGVLADGPEGAGQRAAMLFFGIWEQPATRDALLSLLRGAMSTDMGGAALREFFGDVMIRRLAPRLPGDDAELRMALVISHLLGAAILRHVVGLPGLVDADVDDLVDRVGATVQPYFTPAA